MNWTKIYNRIPDRVRLGIGGIVLAMLFVAGPTLLKMLLISWS